MIRFEAVSKQFPNGTHAVTDLDLEVGEGELCVLVGPSGGGKTTILRMVNRLTEPTSGRVLVRGEDVSGAPKSELRRRTGYVIQESGLFPHLRVEDNVATVPKLLGWDKTRVKQRVEEMLELVGLAGYGRRYPHELSGGQAQRVGVARALAGDPPVLLMDEPFGAVDPIARARLQDEFLHLQAQLHKTVILVTHDVDEAMKMADRVAVLSQGGVLEQYGSPAEVLASPATAFVAEFLGTDRGLRQLAVTLLRASDVEVPGIEASAALGPETPRVQVGAPLKDAFSAMLAEGRVGVYEGEELLGALTPRGLVEALRRQGQ
ncbi:MAG TPA: ABC transporter ATP-binding protein [Acidimicrobiales bacterium]|nr:ABC transporter ATP-binding protein [Acidimicrobiales bacterium]